jgi:hypothetical protein
MNNKRWLVLVICFWVGMVVQPANAKGLNYSYADIGFSYVDAEEVASPSAIKTDDGMDGPGATVSISYGVLDFVHIKFAYSRLFLDVDVPGGKEVDVDVDRFVMGIGGNYSLKDNIDVLGTVSYVDEEYGNDIPSESDDGYQIDAGLRAKLTKKLELNATGTYVRLDGETDSGIGAGAVYKLVKKFALSGNVRYLNDAEELELFAGLRINF